MAYRRKSGLKGASRVRKLLKALPEGTRAELAAELEKAAPAILAQARSETPVKTGALRAGLSYKVFPKSLRLQVGLRGRKRNGDLFYGWILEQGRKAQTVSRRSPNGGRHPYRVSPIGSEKFDIVKGRTKMFARRLLQPALNRAFEKALVRASALAGPADV